VLYQLTFLLFDCLADNCIVYIANKWKEMENDINDECTKDDFKQNLLLLKTAAKLYTVDDDDKSVTDLLHNFLVGTERPKNHTPPPRDPGLLGPLVDLDLSSINMQAERRLLGEGKPVEKKK
jgi:hypothetical protein